MDDHSCWRQSGPVLTRRGLLVAAVCAGASAAGLALVSLACTGKNPRIGFLSPAHARRELNSWTPS
jgi:hypothetical protein